MVNFPGALTDEPLAKHTSWHIGGPAKFFLTAKTADQILAAVQAAEEQKIPWQIIGGGTNILAADQGFDGLIIQAANNSFSVADGVIMAEAGALTALVARQAAAAGLYGFEWAATIPGTVGGAIFGNAGCFGGEMKDAVMSVDAWRIKDHQRVKLSNKDCQFGYRESLFKREPHIILGCELKLTKPPLLPEGEQEGVGVAAVQNKIAEFLAKRQESQPAGESSAGSVFKNFDFKNDSELEILKHSVEIPAAMLAQKRIAAGWLVEQVGMKGYRIGRVRVSEKHGNFFLAEPGARAHDVLALISYVKMKVRDELGIELQEEIQYLGF